MYCPESFRVTDLERLHDFIQRESFATPVSNTPDGPVASHVPLLLDRQRGPSGCLIGHLARANPQWRTAAGQSVLAIFHGPHAYVSPSWYEKRDVVPTWNYATVHARGMFTPLEDRERLRSLVRETVARYEAARPQPWSADAPDAEFFDRLLEGIVGFEIPIARLDGKWKLSQNHSLARRRKVQAALQASGDPQANAVAALMAGTLAAAEEIRPESR